MSPNLELLIQTAIFLSFFLSFFFLTFSGLTPCGIWDLSSPTRDGTCAPALGVQSLNHWTSREVLPRLLFWQRTPVIISIWQQGLQIVCVRLIFNFNFPYIYFPNRMSTYVFLRVLYRSFLWWICATFGNSIVLLK